MNNALNEGDGLWNFSGNVCFYRPKTLFICDDLTTNLSTRTIILALCRIFVVKSEKIGFSPSLATVSSWLFRSINFWTKSIEWVHAIYCCAVRVKFNGFHLEQLLNRFNPIRRSKIPYRIQNPCSVRLAGFKATIWSLSIWKSFW